MHRSSDISKADSHKSYRPITVMSFRLNYWLHRNLFDHPSDGHRRLLIQLHATNVLFHALVSCQIFFVCQRCFSTRSDNLGRTASFIAAVIFATHPVHTEAVSGLGAFCALSYAVLVLTSINFCSWQSRAFERIFLIFGFPVLPRGDSERRLFCWNLASLCFRPASNHGYPQQRDFISYHIDANHLGCNSTLPARSRLAHHTERATLAVSKRVNRENDIDGGSRCWILSFSEDSYRSLHGNELSPR
jgi:hypothetical protein